MIERSERLRVLPALSARTFGRHQVAAAAATAVDFAVMALLVEAFALSAPAASLVSALVGGVTNFSLARTWAFRGPSAGAGATYERSFAQQAGRYAVACAFGALLNASLLALLLTATEGPYLLARALVAVLVSVFYTYPAHALFVFRSAEEPDVDQARDGRNADGALGELAPGGGAPQPPRMSRPEAVARVAPFALAFVVHTVLGATRLDMLGASALVGGLAFGGRRAAVVLRALYPIGLVGLLYDTMRPFQTLGLTTERVHVCDVRALEAALFGFDVGGERWTLHDYFLVHHTPVLDLLAALPYATFILASAACAVYLARRDPPAMRRFVWGFFALNVAGFVTYHVFPVAPPWYFHQNGCVVDLGTGATEGPALARVDAMLGIPYFHGMYAKASSVFGAIPSLHCAYPSLIVLEGRRSFGPKLFACAVGYLALMVFAAVYLDHHWLLDALAGFTYALVVSFALRRLFAARGAQRLPAPGAA